MKLEALASLVAASVFFQVKTVYFLKILFGIQLKKYLMNHLSELTRT